MGTEAFAGTVGDSYNNARADNVDGSSNNEPIRASRLNDVVDVQIATIKRVIWWIGSRRHQCLDYCAPAQGCRRVSDDSTRSGYIGNQETRLGTKPRERHTVGLLSALGFTIVCQRVGAGQP